MFYLHMKSYFELCYSGLLMLYYVSRRWRKCSITKACVLKIINRIDTKLYLSMTQKCHGYLY